jgi:hypothetical protein
MLFQQRQDVLKPLTSVAYGDRVQIEIPREFFLENIIIHIRASAGATAPSWVGATQAEPHKCTTDGLAGILDNVRLTVATGANTRAVVNCSSAALMQYQRQTNGGVDRWSLLYGCPILATPWTASQVRDVFFPINFAPPNLDDPVASAFLLPLPRYTANPILEFTVQASAPLFASNPPTLQYRVLMNRRFVDVPNFPTYDTELAENKVTYPAVGDALPWELPAPGAYTSILGLLYNSTGTVRQPWYQMGGSGLTPWEIKFLGTTLRRHSTWDLNVMADYSAEIFTAQQASAGTFGDHALFWDFLSDKVGSSAADFGSVLDTTPLIAQGARVQLLASIGQAGTIIKFVSHRVFGDISALKMGVK